MVLENRLAFSIYYCWEAFFHGYITLWPLGSIIVHAPGFPQRTLSWIFYALLRRRGMPKRFRRAVGWSSLHRSFLTILFYFWVVPVVFPAPLYVVVPYLAVVHYNTVCMKNYTLIYWYHFRLSAVETVCIQNVRLVRWTDRKYYKSFKCFITRQHPIRKEFYICTHMIDRKILLKPEVSQRWYLYYSTAI